MVSSCVCLLDNVSCMICMFIERVKENFYLYFFSVSGLECLSLDVVSLSDISFCLLMVCINNTLKKMFLCFNQLLDPLHISRNLTAWFK